MERAMGGHVADLAAEKPVTIDELQRFGQMLGEACAPINVPFLFSAGDVFGELITKTRNTMSVFAPKSGIGNIPNTVKKIRDLRDDVVRACVSMRDVTPEMKTALEVAYDNTVDALVKSRSKGIV